MNINKGTRTLVIIMIAVIALGLTYAYFYYKNINENVDPRLVHTQEILAQFDQINKLDSPFLALKLMEDLEDRLLTTELYKSSYEIGVVRNNKASVYLMMALYGEEYQSLKDSLFASASYELELAESTFIDWMKQYKTISDDLIQEELLKAYSKTPKILKDKNLEKLAEQRLEDIHLAKIETPRRLSVVYTNMAIIERHTNLLDSAIAKNQRAIELWPENHEAKNNLRTLFGLEREKRGAIKKLFPSKRSEDY